MDDRNTEPLGAELSAEQVKNRVEDWRRRLEKLYNSITLWAQQNGWEVQPGPAIPMTDEPIRRSQLEPFNQPSLKLSRKDIGLDIWVRPKGLWIVGANGRVDLITSKESAMLTDSAMPFQPARWRIHLVSSRPDQGQHGSGLRTSGTAFRPKLLAELH